MSLNFTPTRQSGLDRLAAFAPRAGECYASQRNFDLGPNETPSVSELSPWIRHRLITEVEVLAQILEHHSAQDAGKFIHEVFWRGYFKGWLEQHPSVWDSYLGGVLSGHETLECMPALKTDYIDATQGRTGIDCFDHWVHELQETRYLHNHARMCFASIWIFTLRLPWELGAEFFLRYLHDGDAASNTLSWRWVGGLHTKGKTYLADASVIERCTGGRFEPRGQLATVAEPLCEDLEHARVGLPDDLLLPKDAYLLLITSDDCTPEGFMPADQSGVLGMCMPVESAFAKGAVADALARNGATSAVPEISQDWQEAIITAAHASGTTHVVTAYAPVGRVASNLRALKETLAHSGIHLHRQRRTYDTVTWPHATNGFFKLKKKIPRILGTLGIAA